MINRVLLAALAVAIVLGVGAYTLDILNERSLRLAEIGRDICHSRHGVGIVGARSVPVAIRNECMRPIRTYEAGRIWRFVFSAAVGATCALLVVGGIVIVVRGRRRQTAVGLGR